MTENFARFKIHSGITTSCREQRTLAVNATKRPPQKAKDNKKE
ncbi:MAG TPA: hypothetical protein O0X50_01555 [Methanocorpusculum sp.]|nr:hypothetical protein [Methanocorpusculum sp.]